MGKIKITLGCMALHFFLIFMGLLTSVRILDLFTGVNAPLAAHAVTENQRFNLLLTEYAYTLIPAGLDNEFLNGMNPASRQIFENLLNTIRYKENCTEYRTPWDKEMSCLVNGREINGIDWGQ